MLTVARAGPARGRSMHDARTSHHAPCTVLYTVHQGHSKLRPGKLRRPRQIKTPFPGETLTRLTRPFVCVPKLDGSPPETGGKHPARRRAYSSAVPVLRVRMGGLCCEYSPVERYEILM